MPGGRMYARLRFTLMLKQYAELDDAAAAAAAGDDDESPAAGGGSG